MSTATHTRARKSTSPTRGCLALNASFEPLRELLPISRAIRLVMDERAEIIEADPERSLRSGSRILEYPAVIRLKQFVHVPHNLRRGVSNTLLFARDGYCCAYCGRHRSELLQREFLTRDHLIPQVRVKEENGNPNTWENVVCACSRCNNAKGDLPLETFLRRTGFHLRVTPTEPHVVHLEWQVRSLSPLQRKWITIFFGKRTMEALD